MIRKWSIIKIEKMKNILVFIFVMLSSATCLWSQDAVVVFDNPQCEGCTIWHLSKAYTEVKGEGSEKSAVRLTGVSLDSLYLLERGDECRIFCVEPGDTIRVACEGDSLILLGGNELINGYLEEWKETMRQAIPGMNFRFYFPFDIVSGMCRMSFYKPMDEIFSKENLTRLSDLERRCVEQLRTFGIEDKAFLARQEERIRHVCWFLNSCVLKFSEMNVAFSLPVGVEELTAPINLNDPSLIDFWQLSPLLNNYFDGVRKYVGVKGDFNQYLAEEARQLKVDAIRETYILDQLNKSMLNGNWECLDEICRACEELIVTEENKAIYRNLSEKIMNGVKEHPFNGKKAMDFAFEDKEGNTVRLSDFLGKYVLIDVWATWCGPCKQQFPFMQKLEEAFKDEDIVFLSLSIDILDDKETWREMVEKKQGEIALFASNGYDTPFVRYYEVEYIPHFLLIGPDGTMLSSKARKPSDPLLKSYLNQLFNIKETEK